MHPDCTDPKLTASDRVAAYFEHITGRPMTRDEKIPLGAVIHGEEEEMDIKPIFDALMDDHIEQMERVNAMIQDEQD